MKWLMKLLGLRSNKKDLVTNKLYSCANIDFEYIEQTNTTIH